jgi:hypothetical protein
MPEESRTDDVEKFLAEEKSLENRKQALIADLLKQKEAAINAFDEKLAKLGFHANSERQRRSHHRKSAADASAANDKKKPKA